MSINLFPKTKHTYKLMIFLNYYFYIFIVNDILQFYNDFIYLFIYLFDNAISGHTTGHKLSVIEQVTWT